MNISTRMYCRTKCAIIAPEIHLLMVLCTSTTQYSKKSNNSIQSNYTSLVSFENISCRWMNNKCPGPHDHWHQDLLETKPTGKIVTLEMPSNLNEWPRLSLQELGHIRFYTGGWLFVSDNKSGGIHWQCCLFLHNKMCDLCKQWCTVLRPIENLTDGDKFKC